MARSRSKERTKRPQVKSDEPLPHNKDAEKALLGSILIDNDAFFNLSGLEPDMFFYKVNQDIYRAITSLALRGSSIDIILVAEELKSMGVEDFGDETRSGELYISHLTSVPTTSMYATEYAEVIRQGAVRRNIIIAANKMATAAWSGEDFQEVVDSSQTDFLNAVQAGVGRKVRHIGDGVDRYVVSLQDKVLDPKTVPGIKTGFVDLDRILNGVKPQELVIVAARPGMGKTAMMLSMVDYLSVKRFGSSTGVIFSLEMSEQELINRLVARRAKIDSQSLDRADLSGDEQAKAYEEAALIKRAPLYITDTPGMSVSQMLAEATRVKMMHGLDYIMVDFLQLANAGSSAELYQKVSKIARDLKNLAKHLEVPVFALSQLSRSVENRPNKRPTMPDLRDSGQIEEAADTILGLYRVDYYEEGVRPNIVEVGVLKQRNGPSNVTIDLFFDGPTITMHNLQRVDPLI